MDDYYSVEKIDIHVHIHTENTDFVTLTKRDHFRFVNISVQSTEDPIVMEQRLRTTLLQYRANADLIAPVSSFSMTGWEEPDWQEKTIHHLDETFAAGAIGVKIWKNIGMVARDVKGNYIMIDDLKFDPIIAHIEKCGKVLVGHLGEPKNCWLSLSEMTVKNDYKYFQENPQYYMFLHPEMPSYQEQIDARDRMLSKHPQVTFVAAHLASLEWSVDEIADFLDRFPNAVVETAARICHLQYQTQQDRAKVISFLIKYQDRVLYGTDLGVGPDDPTVAIYEKAHTTWERDWEYFNTENMITVPELDAPVQGLALPREVVEKLYSKNAKRIFSRSWRSTPSQ